MIKKRKQKTKNNMDFTYINSPHETGFEKHGTMMNETRVMTPYYSKTTKKFIEKIERTRNYSKKTFKIFSNSEPVLPELEPVFWEETKHLNKSDNNFSIILEDDKNGVTSLKIQTRTYFNPNTNLTNIDLNNINVLNRINLTPSFDFRKLTFSLVLVENKSGDKKELCKYDMSQHKEVEVTSSTIKGSANNLDRTYVEMIHLPIPFAKENPLFIDHCSYKLCLDIFGELKDAEIDAIVTKCTRDFEVSAQLDYECETHLTKSADVCLVSGTEGRKIVEIPLSEGKFFNFEVLVNCKGAIESAYGYERPVTFHYGVIEKLELFDCGELVCELSGSSSSNPKDSNKRAISFDGPMYLKLPVLKVHLSLELFSTSTNYGKTTVNFEVEVRAANKKIISTHFDGESLLD